MILDRHSQNNSKFIMLIERGQNSSYFDIGTFDCLQDKKSKIG